LDTSFLYKTATGRPYSGLGLSTTKIKTPIIAVSQMGSRIKILKYLLVKLINGVIYIDFGLFRSNMGAGQV